MGLIKGSQDMDSLYSLGCHQMYLSQAQARERQSAWSTCCCDGRSYSTEGSSHSKKSSQCRYFKMKVLPTQKADTINEAI